MIGTVVVDEVILEIAAIELLDGQVIVVAEINGPGASPAFPFGTMYRIHGSDGSLVWRGRIRHDVGGYDLGERDRWELRIAAGVTDKIATELERL